MNWIQTFIGQISLKKTLSRIWFLMQLRLWSDRSFKSLKNMRTKSTGKKMANQANLTKKNLSLLMNSAGITL